MAKHQKTKERKNRIRQKHKRLKINTNEQEPFKLTNWEPTTPAGSEKTKNLTKEKVSDTKKRKITKKPNKI